MPWVTFNKRVTVNWRRLADAESQDRFDLPWMAHRSNVIWTVDPAGQYHFNVPRVIVHYSPDHWRVGQADVPATLDFALNILAAFIDDANTWLLHREFYADFLRELDGDPPSGLYRITGAEILAWLALRAGPEGFGPPRPLYNQTRRSVRSR